MKSTQRIAVLILLCIFSIGTQVNAQMNDMATGKHVIMVPGDIKWMDGPPALPAGVKLAVLAGDPGAAGEFTIRLKMPAGYAVKPHSHPTDERLTILEGTLNMGSGDKFDKGTTTAVAKDGFAIMKAGMTHYVYTDKGCTLQLSGMGPFVINYVNVSDDPRNMKK